MKLIYKSIVRISLLLFITATLFSCNDSFLEKYPEDELTEEQFFKTVMDLELFVNGMSGYMGPTYWEVSTDNATNLENDRDNFKLLRGQTSSRNIDAWDWENIRNVNYMLNRADRVTGDSANINHYIGIAKMWRAKLFYDKVKQYSDVPWYDKDLNTDDTEELFKTQDSRAFVVNKIFEDLDYAVVNILEGDSKTKIHKNTARMMKARIALHEGTFRNYHPELGLNDGGAYLEIAWKTAEEIMKTGDYSISTASNKGFPAYQSLFNTIDLSDNTEVIYMRDYDKALDETHNAHNASDWMSGMPRNLAEDYLYYVKNDLTVPAKSFTTVPGYETMPVATIFKDRDPRMSQTIMPPEYIKLGSESYNAPELEYCGYAQIKFHPVDNIDQLGFSEDYTDIAMFRYAETLLIYAEARAELGILTDTDVANTVGELRNRLGMPIPTTLATLKSEADDVQRARYNYNGQIKGDVDLILALRRERRAELACEGFRKDDLFRWAAGKALEVGAEGVYVPQGIVDGTAPIGKLPDYDDGRIGESYPGAHYFDINGDQIPDYALYETKEEMEAGVEALVAFSNAVEKYNESQSDLTKHRMGINVSNFAMDDADLSWKLTNGTYGHVVDKSQLGAHSFKEPDYYYIPMSIEDMLYNENLKQTKYWSGE